MHSWVKARLWPLILKVWLQVWAPGFPASSSFSSMFLFVCEWMSTYSPTASLTYDSYSDDDDLPQPLCHLSMLHTGSLSIKPILITRLMNMHLLWDFSVHKRLNYTCRRYYFGFIQIFTINLSLEQLSIHLNVCMYLKWISFSSTKRISNRIWFKQDVLSWWVKFLLVVQVCLISQHHQILEDSYSVNI